MTLAFAAAAVLMLAATVLIMARAMRRQDSAASFPLSERGGIIVVALFLCISAPLLYATLGAPRLLTATPAAPDPVQLQAQLEQWLQDNPNDADALALMGDSMMAQQRYIEAGEHYQRARAIAGDTPQLLVSHLQAMAWSDDPELDSLLALALETVPESPLVLWIAGARARDLGDLPAARGYWKRLRPQLAGTEMQADVDAALADLDAQQAAAASGVAVTVVVRLDMQATVAADTPLYVIARAADKPMPLAATRHSASALPLTVVLDDSASMLPTAKMSDSAAYQIIARLSKAGDPRAAPGDLYGETPATPGAIVTVEINQTVE